jgi:hypothetical protein
VQVLEAGEIAAGEDQVHPLGVEDVEAAHRVAIGVDDPEPQRCRDTERQLAIYDDQPQAVVGDG